MATTPDTLSSMDEALQIDYQPVYKAMIYGASRFAMILKKKGKKRTVGGKSLQSVWAARTVQGMGYRSLSSEGGDHALPRPDRSKNYTLGLTDDSYSFEITGKLLSAARKAGPKFIGNLLKEKNSYLLENQQFQCAVALFGDGTKLIGQISAISGNRLTINGNGVRHARPGQYVQVYNLTTGGVVQLTGTPEATEGAEVEDVDRQNDYLHISDATGASVNDYVFPHGVYDAVHANGLQNIVASTGTFQNVNRATVGNSFAKAFVLDLGGATLEERNWMELNNLISRFAPNQEVLSMYVTDHDTCNDIFEILSSRQRYQDNDVYDIGFKTMRVHTPDGPKAVVPEKMCNDGDVYGINPDEFAWMHPEGEEGGSWFNEDGKILRPKPASTAGSTIGDGWQAYRNHRYNLACDDAQAQALMTNFIGP